MSENFTREHKLVEEIVSQGWFASPAGRQGYEVIVLERVGDGGTRFYYNLKPGETLRFSERVFGKFIALAVDVRYARSFPIEGQFSARERGRSVTLKANVRYRVTDARVVAMETLDPLGALRDRVIAALNRELSRYPEGDITPGLIERIVGSVGPVPELGLTIEGAEVIQFTPDQRVTKKVVEEEDLHDDLHIQGIKSQAEINGAAQAQAAELSRKRDKYEAVNLTDINTLMHEHPELIPTVFNAFTQRDLQLLDAQRSVVIPAIEAYIRQQQEREADIDPQAIARIMREALVTQRPQIQGPATHEQIVWGEDIKALPQGKSEVIFADEDSGKEKPNKEKPADSGRIVFGD